MPCYIQLGKAITASAEESSTIVLHWRPQRDSECKDKGGLISTIPECSKSLEKGSSSETARRKQAFGDKREASLVD